MKVNNVRKLLVAAALFPLMSFGEYTGDKYDLELNHKAQQVGKFYIKGLFNAVCGGSDEQTISYSNTIGDGEASIKPSIPETTESKYSPGRGSGLAIGYSFSKIRVELESVDFGLNKSKNNTSEGTRGTQYMNIKALNGYYDFALSNVVMPYVGIGVFIPGIQGKIGANFNLMKFSEKIIPYIGYRLLFYYLSQTDDITYKLSILLHNIEAGFTIPLDI